MRTGVLFRRGRGGRIVTVVSVTGALALAGPALAAASTISVASDTATPEQAVPVDLTVSGTNDSGAGGYLNAVVRPAGGLACQASYPEDASTLGPEDAFVAFGQPAVPAGPYSASAEFRPSAPGSYQVCAWLSQNADGSGPLAPPATLTLTAQGPQVSKLAVSAPTGLTPNTPFQIAYTTQTDQQLSLLSALVEVKTPTATGCAASYEQQSGAFRTVFGPDARQVFGGPVTTPATVTEATGYYDICTWIEGPTSGEVDKSLSTPITVGTPTVAVSPRLRLTKATASRRRGISVAGTAAAKFTGRVAVAASCDRARSTGSARVRHGRFSAHLRVPSRCTRARRVTVSVRWAGSAAYVKQLASRSVRLTK